MNEKLILQNDKQKKETILMKFRNLVIAPVDNLQIIGEQAFNFSFSIIQYIIICLLGCNFNEQEILEIRRDIF